MDDISHKIEDYVNEQNYNLWEELKNHYQFKLFYDGDEYSWKTRNEITHVLIITPSKKIDFASFTHELLHTYIEYKGMTQFDSFQESYLYQSIFSNFVFNNLFSSIYNFCAHKKMYPYFTEMGFKDREFVMNRFDYNWRRHFTTKMMFKMKWLRVFALEQFLGNYFSLKNNVVLEDQQKCTKFLGKLKRLKPELYSIAENFDNSWSNQTDLNLLEPFDSFKNELIDWIVLNYQK